MSYSKDKVASHNECQNHFHAYFALCISPPSPLCPPLSAPILPLPHDRVRLPQCQATTDCLTVHVLVCNMSGANVCRWMRAAQPRPALLPKLVPAVLPSPRPARSGGRGMMMRMRSVVKHAEFECRCTLSAKWLVDHDAKHSQSLQLPCCLFVAATVTHIVERGYARCCRGNYRAHMRIPDVTLIAMIMPNLC